MSRRHHKVCNFSYVTLLISHLGTISKRTSNLPYIAIGSGAGGLVFGLLLGGLIAWLISRRSYKKKMRSARYSGIQTLNGPVTDTYRPLLTGHSVMRTPSPLPTSRTELGASYQVEPFHMPDEVGQLHRGPLSQSHSSGYTGSLAGVPHATTIGHHTSPQTSTAPLPVQSIAESSNARPRQLYVLHHDSGLPPVTIYHQEGTEVVELPPRWTPPTGMVPSNPDEWQSPSDATSASASASGSGIAGQTERSEISKTSGLTLHQARQPGTIRKLPGTPD